VETYWKSTTILQSTQVSPSSSLHHSTSAHNSPSIHSIIGSPGHALTVSSLSGEYVYAVIQVTRDLQPVVYPNLRLADVEFNLGVADVTLAQFEALASRSGKRLDLKNTDPQNLAAAISGSMCSLSQLLKVHGFNS
jgi:CDK inhibitor PHO81